MKYAEIKNLTIRTGTIIFKNVAGENLKYPAMKLIIAKGSGVVAASMIITHPYFKNMSPYFLNFFCSTTILAIFAAFKYLPVKKAINPHREDITPKISTIKKYSSQPLD